MRFVFYSYYAQYSRMIGRKENAGEGIFAVKKPWTGKRRGSGVQSKQLVTDTSKNPLSTVTRGKSEYYEVETLNINS